MSVVAALCGCSLGGNGRHGGLQLRGEHGSILALGGLTDIWGGFASAAFILIEQAGDPVIAGSHVELSDISPCSSTIGSPSIGPASR